MSEINIARTIIKKRKEKGITQDELANYIGVSKASVSKWETGQSYPDILLLPQLAAHFNISIDELMGYEPQMSKKDIGKLYYKLYEDFSKKPLDEVIEECRMIIKEYYSCFPLLLQMGSLLIGVSGMTDDKDKTSALVEEARALIIRVKTESNNAELMKTALHMEALCASMLGEYNEVIELLGDSVTIQLPHEPLLSAAYRMTGRNTKADAVLQAGIYQNITSVLNLLTTYIQQGAENIDRLDELVGRALSIISAFKIKSLQPYLIVNFYLIAAHGYLLHQNTEKALELLEEYAQVVTGEISLQMKGDGFFNLIDEWLNEPDGLGQLPPPVEESMKQILADAVIDNPLFSALNDEPRFQKIVKELESKCKSEH